MRASATEPIARIQVDQGSVELCFSNCASGRVPWYAKAVAACVAGYALSPIDLIPDFVPILGYLDDLILVPLGIMLAIRLIPAPVLSDLRRTAADQLARRPTSWIGAIAIIGIWLVCAALAAWWTYSAFWPR